MSDFLGQMAAHSLARAEAAERALDLGTLRAMALDTAPPPALCLHPDGFDVIAEVKLRSPSEGPLAPAGAGIAYVLDRVRLHERAGAVAHSVLTEPSAFEGHLDHLRAAALLATRPVMRKDFLVKPYQVWEAREAGAGGVLLIVRLVSDGVLAELCRAVLDCGLFCLLECFDEADLVRAARVSEAWSPSNPPLLIGVNSRDLGSLGVSESAFEAASRAIPAGCVGVAESGMRRAQDCRAARGLGFGVGLVGTALMRSGEPEELLRAMIGAGRAAVPR